MMVTFFFVALLGLLASLVQVIDSRGSLEQESRPSRDPPTIPVSLLPEDARQNLQGQGDALMDVRRKVLGKFSGKMLEHYRRKQRGEYVYAPRDEYSDEEEHTWRKHKAAKDRDRRNMPLENRARMILRKCLANTWEEALEKAREYNAERKRAASEQNIRYYAKKKQERQKLEHRFLELQNMATSPSQLPEQERQEYYVAQRALQEFDEKIEKNRYARRIHYRMHSQGQPIEEAMALASFPNVARNSIETCDALTRVRKNGPRDRSKPESCEQTRQRNLWAAYKLNQRERGRAQIRKETLENPEIPSTFERMRLYKERVTAFHDRMRGGRRKSKRLASLADRRRQGRRTDSDLQTASQTTPSASSLASRPFPILEAAESIGSAAAQASPGESSHGAARNTLNQVPVESSSPRLMSEDTCLRDAIEDASSRHALASQEGASAAPSRLSDPTKSPSPDTVMATHFRAWWHHPSRP